MCAETKTTRTPLHIKTLIKSQDTATHLFKPSRELESSALGWVASRCKESLVTTHPCQRILAHATSRRYDSHTRHSKNVFAPSQTFAQNEKPEESDFVDRADPTNGTI